VYPIYDAQGQLLTLNHWWDVLGSGGTYTSYAVLGNTCTYDPTLGLKTSSSFWVQNTSTPTAFTLSRTETYGYDQYLDYLTSANYNDGLNNSSPTWSYDAAGNRTDSGSTFDNLNRATAIQGTACTNDILGNRLTLGAAPNGISYSWDAVNRLASYQNGAGTATTYLYRADGMRVSKMVPPGVTTRYRYDGQMGIEDANCSTGQVTQYGLGVRGIESITNPAAGVMYPIYDGHGNMTGTICRSGTNSFTLANQRSYDAWGLVRSGSGSGDPTGRYCANLGHKQDDESGLIYMRARYYEPGSGRFMTEDGKCKGLNWYAYCRNNPVSLVDSSGNDEFTDYARNQVGRFLAAIGGVFLLAAIAFLIDGWNCPDPASRTIFWDAAMDCTKNAFFYYSVGQTSADGLGPYSAGLLIAFDAKYQIYDRTIGTILRGMQVGSDTEASLAVIACGAYSLWVTMELFSQS
jgi:RHS repeat-associated protein